MLRRRYVWANGWTRADAPIASTMTGANANPSTARPTISRSCGLRRAGSIRATLATGHAHVGGIRCPCRFEAGAFGEHREAGGVPHRARPLVVVEEDEPLGGR